MSRIFLILRTELFSGFFVADYTALCAAPGLQCAAPAGAVVRRTGAAVHRTGAEDESICAVLLLCYTGEHYSNILL